MNNNEFNNYIGNMHKRIRNRLLNEPHAIRFEIIVPPIDLCSCKKEVEPVLQMSSRGGHNLITKALLIKCLQEFIDESLGEENLADALRILKLITEKESTISSEGWHANKGEDYYE